MEARIFSYGGPNIFARQPLLRLSLELEELALLTTRDLNREFGAALVRYLPGVEQDRELARVARDGEYLVGHLVLALTRKFLADAGAAVGFAEVRRGDTPSTCNVLLGYTDEDVSGRALRLALRAVEDLILRHLLRGGRSDGDFPFDRLYADFLSFAEERLWLFGFPQLIDEAKTRKIAISRMGTNFLMLGQGCHQRMLFRSMTDRTSYLGVQISTNKWMVNFLLDAAGLPVPVQHIATDAAAAVRAAESIGYPVVVKPISSDMGRGVFAGITDADGVRFAFARAREFSDQVLVEDMIPGDDHRLLVIGGKMVAAARRLPGHVIGDGTHNVEELLEILNSDPRRGTRREAPLSRLQFDDQAEKLLADAGLGLSSVPAPGERVFLRRNANLSTGGFATDVTDVVHPDNREMAELAAARIDLDVAGIDFITTDVTQSYREGRGAICEVNVNPGLRMHIAPSEGEPRPVYGMILDHLFPAGSASAVPIAAITGTDGKTTVCRMVARILETAGHTVGLTTTEGVYIGGLQTKSGDSSGPAGARSVLIDRRTTAAVLETARGALVRNGLGFENCNVGAVLNVRGDHVGFDGIETNEQLAEAKRLVVEVADDAAVLNADDPLCLAMRDHVTASATVLVSTDPGNPEIVSHVAAGGTAVVWDKDGDGRIARHVDGAVAPVIAADDIPATLAGAAPHNAENAAFAAAIAGAMGVDDETIRDALSSITLTYEDLPGRISCYDGHPFKVVLDYAHNPHELATSLATINRFEVAGRRICALTSPGNRPNQQVKDMGAAAAPHFDHFVCYSWDDLRGRERDDVPDLLMIGLAGAGIAEDRIEKHPDIRVAIDAALGMAEPDDLVVVFASESATAAWEQITAFKDGA